MEKNRIEKLFENNKHRKNGYFMPFLVAGDPNINQFVKLAQAIEPYADILEVGIPFSDPIADGPVIQDANQRAFGSGITTQKAVQAIGKIRVFTEKPIVVLTYYNILIQGEDTIEGSLNKTFTNLRKNGVDGIVIADLPIEEASLALKYAEENNIFIIFLVAPSTTDERLDKILEKAKGFLYIIAVMGVTGTREKVNQITDNVIRKVKNRLKKDLPLFIGFGISKPEHATALINEGADGIIIGSAIVKIISEHPDDFDRMEKSMVQFVSTIRKALDIKA